MKLVFNYFNDFISLVEVEKKSWVQWVQKNGFLAQWI